MCGAVASVSDGWRDGLMFCKRWTKRIHIYGVRYACLHIYSRELRIMFNECYQGGCITESIFENICTARKLYGIATSFSSCKLSLHTNGHEASL